MNNLPHGGYPHAATCEGQLLMALRAGPVVSGALKSRLGESVFQRASTKAFRDGLVNRWPDGDGEYVYVLTAAGRAKCPSRRSLIGWIDPLCRAVASEQELMESGA